jgi:16S rRNA G966 N2-methylase RsmD
MDTCLKFEHAFNKLRELAVRKDFYLEVRTNFNIDLTKNDLENAAQFLFLNKTAFNGMYRENSRGEFNVPFNNKENLRLFEKEQFLANSDALKSASLSVLDYRQAVSKAKSGDLVYFDPPYIPLSTTAAFVDYTKSSFGPSAQEELRDTAKEIRSLDNACAFVNYYADDMLGKQLLEEIKNWSTRKSGPKPNLLNINFLSAALASRIALSGAEAIVPVPSTRFSGIQPAMVSVRLAHAIAILLALPCYEVLHKSNKHEFGTLATRGSSPIRGRKVALVDDQITTGKSMQIAKEILLRDLEAREVICVAWSTTKAWANP